MVEVFLKFQTQEMWVKALNETNTMTARAIVQLIDAVGAWSPEMCPDPGSSPEYLRYPSIETLFSTGLLLGILWVLFYSLFKDCLFCGRSLGKLICGLRIISSENGKKPSFISLILRNIPLAIVQIEAIVVLANKGKRLGDYLAKTQVVRSTTKENASATRF